MNRRILAIAFAAAAASCTDTGTGVDGGIADGTVRVIVLTNPGELVEYSAPPLQELRRFDLNSALSPRVQFVAMNRDSGGFFAYALPAAPMGPRTWDLVRYDRAWVEVARRPVSDYIGQDTVVPDAFRLTPDGRFLVGHVPVRSVAGLPPQILVLDAATLDVVRRVDSQFTFPFLMTGPDAATGSQLVIREFHSPCTETASWLDVATGVVVDSVTVPCGYVLQGMQTRRRLYVTPAANGPQPLMIWDVDANQVVATQSAEPIVAVLPDPGKNRIIGIGGAGIILMNAQTLALQGVIATAAGPAPAEGSVRLGVVDRASGAFVGETWGPPPPCAGCYGEPTGVVVIDLDRRQIIARQTFAEPLMIWF